MSTLEGQSLTSESGAPVADNQNSQTAGVNGPVLLQDSQLIEKLAHFNRERIPERVVHAVGLGAHGSFRVTNPDIKNYTRMAMLSEVGKQTEVFARFSTVAGSRGAADTARDPRGFALKFYTEEGNWDMVGNNTPIFFIRDAIKFPDFIHSQKPDPRTNQQEADNVWDFFANSPEATHQFVWLFGDRGIPASVRKMDGFGSHTFQWVNAAGERFWVKFHFKSNQGIETLTTAEAAKIGGENPQYMLQDLREAIEAGDYPTWTLKVQIMPEADAATYRVNPFDVTKVWNYADYPLIEVGVMTLDRFPDNFFWETEQAAFNPGNFVPGVGPSPDKMLQGRLFAYPDAHRYRLGINHSLLPVNQPHGVEGGARVYHRDGTMRVDNNGGSSKNYEPNSYGGPAQTNEPLYNPFEVSGVTGSTLNEVRQVGDFEQAGDLYRLQDAAAQQRLIDNIADGLAQVSKPEVIEKAIGHFTKADAEFGQRLTEAVAQRQA